MMRFPYIGLTLLMFKQNVVDLYSSLSDNSIRLAIRALLMLACVARLFGDSDVLRLNIISSASESCRQVSIEMFDARSRFSGFSYQDSLTAMPFASLDVSSASIGCW